MNLTLKIILQLLVGICFVCCSETKYSTDLNKNFESFEGKDTLRIEYLAMEVDDAKDSSVYNHVKRTYIEVDQTKNILFSDSIVSRIFKINLVIAKLKNNTFQIYSENVKKEQYKIEFSISEDSLIIYDFPAVFGYTPNIKTVFYHTYDSTFSMKLEDEMTISEAELELKKLAHKLLPSFKTSIPLNLKVGEKFNNEHISVQGIENLEIGGHQFSNCIKIRQLFPKSVNVSANYWIHNKKGLIQTILYTEEKDFITLLSDNFLLK